MSRRGTEKRLQPWMIGLIAVALTVFAFYLGFAKKLPFTGHGYQVSAVFSNAQQIRVKSPVRIAGVNVGKVAEVKHLVTDGEGQQAAVVKLELTDDALPIKQDATMELRPRLFLEGNLFVDLHPGSPSAPELKSGGTIPIAQTSTSVQLDQVLTTLQAPVRSDLQTFLIEFGSALDKYGGGAGLRTSFKTSPDAYRYTAEVNEALLGTQPGDLTGLVVNLDSFIRALNQNQTQLQDLVGNLGTVLTSFGREGDALETAIFTLPQVLSEGRPALVRLNAALPVLRAFSRELLPGVRSAGPALDAANPFIAQLRGLVQPSELSGLVDDLRPVIPSLAKLAQVTVPFLEQARALSSCFNNVVIPWSNTDIPGAVNDVSDITAPVYKETGYGLVGISGESRSGDANGQYIRVGVGGGTNTIVSPDFFGAGNDAVGSLLAPLLGAQPALTDSAKTPFRPDVACETQDPPDLNTTTPVAPPNQTASSRSSANTLTGSAGDLAAEEGHLFTDLLRGKQRGGKAGQLQQQQALEGLQQFYKDKLPLYQQLLKGGGG
jgi:phospholipid/cholesterol/gamma-HCH transport system substrate-binding protein